MKKFPQGLTAAAVLLLFCMTPSPGSAAKLQTDLIDSGDHEARYLVSWEAGTFTSGGLYTGSLNRANKKIVRRSQEFCAEQGFHRWRFASLAEIAEDETLRAAWDIATGGTGKSHSTERTGNFLLGVETHNRVRRVLILTKSAETRGPCKEAVVQPGNPAPSANAETSPQDPDAPETTEADPETLESYRVAAEQGDAAAQNRLGEMYGTGKGVPKDYRAAVKWYRLAAEQGHALAQLNLGLAYARGLGVPSDYVRAHLWLNLASTSGDEAARQERDELTEKMLPEQTAEAQRLAREWWESRD